MITIENISVLEVQKKLNSHGFSVKEDNIWGNETEDELLDFQRKRGLYTDGIVGAITWALLNEEGDNFQEPPKKLKFDKVECDVWEYQGEKSFRLTTLRQDASKSFRAVRNKVRKKGGLITSSGGRRMLSASVGPNRSKKSLHYLGIAHDLYVQSGMRNPKKDPYVIVKTEKDKEFWTVFARAKDGEKMSLKGFTYNHEEIEVEDNFVNLTKLFKEEGWEPISPRRSFFTKKHWLASEWWHFQYEKILTPKKSTFGEQLLKIYKRKDLEKYKIWDYRQATWKKDWF